MDDFFKKLNEAGTRSLLIGGQSMRLRGMARYSLDWDLFIPPRDPQNIERLNAVLEKDLECPIKALGSRREGFIQTHNTRWGVLQLHLLVPGVPDFSAAESGSVWRDPERGHNARCLGGADLLAAKRGGQSSSRPSGLDISPRTTESGNTR